jgi:hypothetical protein
MNELRTTNWLLLWIALMVFNKFYPDTARDYWYIAIGIMAFWAIYTFVKTSRRDNAERKEEQKEINKRNAFMSELDAIRKRYDPAHAWNEATTLPEAYESEVVALRRKHGIVD